MNPWLAGEQLEKTFWVKETTCAKKKRGGHARNYSLKDIVESFSLTGMVSGEKKDNGSGTGTRGMKSSLLS